MLINPAESGSNRGTAADSGTKTQSGLGSNCVTQFPARFRGPSIAELGEQETISRIIAKLPSHRNGDDAAVLGALAPNSRPVVSTDMLVHGQHFRTDWSLPAEIGYKSIVQSFADIEAMGARPIASVLALGAPSHTPISYLEEMCGGIGQVLARYSAEMVGGDVTLSDQLTLSVTAVGTLGGSFPELTLDRARPGQKLVAAGRIGYSAAGLALLQRFGRGGVPEELFELVLAHCQPTLVPQRGVVARATGATAMTDNSDGLTVDLATMARRSGVRIDVLSEAIAPDELLLAAGELLDADPWEWILTGGEDHTLLATTDGEPPSGFRTIGRVYRQRGALPVSLDGEVPPYFGGWQSLSSAAKS